MIDQDFECNVYDPEALIAAYLDNAAMAEGIMEVLEAHGYEIVKKEQEQ